MTGAFNTMQLLLRALCIYISNVSSDSRNRVFGIRLPSQHDPHQLVSWPLSSSRQPSASSPCTFPILATLSGQPLHLPAYVLASLMAFVPGSSSAPALVPVSNPAPVPSSASIPPWLYLRFSAPAYDLVTAPITIPARDLVHTFTPDYSFTPSYCFSSHPEPEAKVGSYPNVSS